MVAIVGSFHLLHMMIDNYLLHTLEAHFEHLQESEYKRQMLSHYSESGTPYSMSAHIYMKFNGAFVK